MSLFFIKNNLGSHLLLYFARHQGQSINTINNYLNQLDVKVNKNWLVLRKVIVIHFRIHTLLLEIEKCEYCTVFQLLLSPSASICAADRLVGFQLKLPASSFLHLLTLFTLLLIWKFLNFERISVLMIRGYGIELQ